MPKIVWTWYSSQREPEHSVNVAEKRQDENILTKLHCEWINEDSIDCGVILLV